MQARHRESNSNLKLEIGKTYRSRSGKFIKIVGHSNINSEFCFCDEVGDTYNSEGWYDRCYDEEIALVHGLIAEVINAEVTKEQPKEKFELTEEIVVEFLQMHGTAYCIEKWPEFIKHKKFEVEPEYQEYLRLKAKYS